MAMDGSPPWANLLDAVLFEIVSRIPCAFDRVHVHAVCSSWRTMLAEIPPPPPLPGVILLKAAGPTFSCIASGWCTYRVFVPDDAFCRARYFGSYDGSWLFLAFDQASGHALVNLKNFQVIDLPNKATLNQRTDFETGIAIIAATLSSKPTEYGCIAGGIISFDFGTLFRSYGNIAFWRKDSHVISKIFRPESPVETVEDVIYRDEAFHFLTPEEHIRVYTASTHRSLLDEVDVTSEEIAITRHNGDCYNQCVVARYLVDSGEDLLMVAMLAPDVYSTPSVFRVFQMAKQELNDDEVQYTWEELLKLDGRMLFVGRGCSRSYKVTDYPGLEAGVYFLDYRRRYDPDILFQDAAERQYDCSGIGKWSGTPPEVKLCVPDQAPSNYSPPVWFLP